MRTIGRCLVAIAFLGAASLAWLRPAANDTVGFSWQEPERSLGIIAIGRSTTLNVPWLVSGHRSIEVVKIQPSCGCSKVRFEHDGWEFSSGGLAAGSHGSATVTLSGKGHPGEHLVTVDVAWRHQDLDRIHVSRLALHATLEAVYQVTPAALVLSDQPQGSSVPFRVSWKALRAGIRLVQPTAKAPAGIQIATLTSRTSADGLVEILAEGLVCQTERHEPIILGRLDLEGVDPVPPEVPIQVAYRQLVTCRPAGMLQLRAHELGSDAEGYIRLELSPEVTGARVREIVVEPETERDRLLATCSDMDDDSIEIRVRRQPAAGETHAMGTIRIAMDRPEVPETRVRWMCMSPRGTSKRIVDIEARQD